MFAVVAISLRSTVSSPILPPPLLPRLAFALMVLTVVAVALDVLGVGGHRYGAIGVVAGLPVTAALTAGLATRRLAVTMVIAAVALAAGSLVVARAPWSAPRLEAALDDLEHLEAFETLETDREGHGWCRPRCPRVTRVYRAADTSPQASVVAMVNALAQSRLVPTLEELADRILTDELLIRTDRIDVSITAERLRPGDLRVTVVLASHR